MNIKPPCNLESAKRERVPVSAYRNDEQPIRNKDLREPMRGEPVSKGEVRGIGNRYQTDPVKRPDLRGAYGS